MRQLPLFISADELIVGNQIHKPHGAIFHDERRPSPVRVPVPQPE